MEVTAFKTMGNLLQGQSMAINRSGDVRLLQVDEWPNIGDVVVTNINNIGISKDRFAASIVNDDGRVTNIADDIANIVDAIEQGQDPTQLDDTLSTAAGNIISSSLINVTSLQRNADETVADTLFETQGLEELGLSRTQSLSLLRQYRQIENSQPVGDDIRVVTDEDVAIEGTLSAFDPNDRDILTYALNTAPEHGQVSLNSNGSWKYTPNEFFNGSDSFSVEVFDGQGGSDTIEVDVNVRPVHGNPVLSIAESDDDSFIGSLEANDGIQLNISLPQGTGVGDVIEVREISGTVVATIEVTRADFDQGTVATTIVKPADGSYSYQAQIIDPQGNLGPVSNLVTITLDTDAPNSNTNHIEFVDDNGVLGEGELASVTLSGKVEAEGEVVSVIIRGKDAQDNPLSYQLNANEFNLADGSLTASGLELSSVGFADGALEVMMTVRDLAGNEGSVMNTIELDITAPGDGINGANHGPMVKIIDDVNDDGFINQIELAQDQVQISVTIDHNELELGGYVSLRINDDTAQLLKLVNGQLVNIDGTAQDKFQYEIDVNGDAGYITWNHDTPVEGSHLDVVASQTDRVGNQSNDGHDSAIIATNPPQSKDFEADVSHEGKTQIVFDVAKTPILAGGNDHISDVEDDATNSELKIVISELPDNGTLYFKEGASYVEITADDLYRSDKPSGEYKQFAPDSIYYQPDADAEGFILGVKDIDLGTEQKATTDYFLNWGVAGDNVKQRIVELGDDTITITANKGSLVQYLGDPKANHIGHGIGVKKDGGIQQDETITIDFTSRPADSITLGLDGLGGWFKQGLGNSKETSVVIDVHYEAKDGSIGTAQYTYQKHQSGNADLFHEISISPNGNEYSNGTLILTNGELPDGAMIHSVELGTQGKGNWELRYLETELSDSFDYHAVDSHGNISGKSTVTLDEINAPPMANDDPGGEFIVALGQYNQGSWQHDGVTDENGLTASFHAQARALTTIGDKLGVAGDVNGGPKHQIQYNRESGSSEEVSIMLDKPVSEFKFSVSNLYKHEGGTANHEQGKWVAYLGETAVASGMFTANDGSNKGEYTYNREDLGDIAFDKIVFDAVDFVIQPSERKGNDSSDYFLTGFAGKGGGDFAANQDQWMEIELKDLLSNDYDIDDDSFRVTAVTQSSEHTDVYIDGDKVYFKSSQAGAMEFKYQLTDDNGGFDEAIVSVIVNPAPQTSQISTISLFESEVLEGEDLVYLVNLDQGVLKPSNYTVHFGKQDDSADDTDIHLANAQFTNGVTYDKGSLTIPVGVSAFSIILPTKIDGQFEADEHYSLMISQPDGSNATSASGTILNAINDANGTEDQPINLDISNVDLDVISSVEFSQLPPGATLIHNGQVLDSLQSPMVIDLITESKIELLPPPDSEQPFTLAIQPLDENKLPIGDAQSIDISIEADADAPTIQILDSQIMSSLDFEQVPLGNRRWRGNVDDDELNQGGDGVIWGTDNKSGHVEVGLEHVYRRGGDGNQVLELEAHRGDHSFFGQFSAEQGAFYTISFDVVARRVKDSPLTVFLESPDGERHTLYEYDPSNQWTRDALEHFQTPSDGIYKVVFESSDDGIINDNSYGVLLDNIQLSKVDNYGYEGQLINLSDIVVLGSSDDNSTADHQYGSELLSVELANIPDGAKVYIAGKEVTVEDSTVDLTHWKDDLQDLQIMIPEAQDEAYSVVVRASSTEPSNGDVETVEETIDITVINNPSNDDLPIVQGGSGDDYLVGGDGAEILIGGLGNDILVGGDQADIFKLIDQGGGIRDGEVDVIKDFKPGEDRIDVSELLDLDDEQDIEDFLSAALANEDDVKLTISDGDNSQSVIVEDVADQYRSKPDGNLIDTNTIIDDFLNLPPMSE